MRTRTLAACLISLAGLGTLAACGLSAHRPGGNMRSDDRHVYVSTPHMPLSVELIDLSTGEAIWRVDVPVGQKAVVQFYQERVDDAGEGYTDLMRWEVYSAKQNINALRSAMAVPPAHLRRLDLKVREAPEFPADEYDRAAGG